MAAGRRRRSGGGRWIVVFVAVVVLAVAAATFLVLRQSDGDTTSAKGAATATVYAPYVLITAQNRPKLVDVAERTGADALHLAFALGTDEGCDLQWDGTTPLATYKTEIQAADTAGIDLIASTGGAVGKDAAVACPTAAATQAALEKLITLGIRYLDFDIEGPNVTNVTANRNRAVAIAALQRKYPNLKVSYTLSAAAPRADGTALGADNTAPWVAAVDAGVVVDRVNLMTMNFGGDVAKKDMGKAAIAAANGLHEQVRTIQGVGDAEAWKIVGVTPMIGVNDITSETFTQEDAATVVDFARSKGVGMLSFWSANRDSKCGADVTTQPSPNCSGVNQEDDEFASILAKIRQT